MRAFQSLLLLFIFFLSYLLFLKYFSLFLKYRIFVQIRIYLLISFIIFVYIFITILQSYQLKNRSKHFQQFCDENLLFTDLFFTVYIVNLLLVQSQSHKNIHDRWDQVCRDVRYKI